MCLCFRTLQAEYDRLREQQEHNNNKTELSRSGDDLTNHDAEMLAEAKLLRQHKGRLEARMRILEDHNHQLEAQLQRLRQLLEQVDTGTGVCRWGRGLWPVVKMRWNTEKNVRI